MNLEETRLPGEWERQPPGETVPPERAEKSPAAALSVGESVAGSYIISAALAEQGRQADVYLAKRWGAAYVVKLYRNGWRPTGQMRSFLQNVRHPNIAGAVDCGELRGQYYEIYPYYEEGTLERAAPLSAAQLRDVVIPSINEGLRCLHASGILHCDIKPSNLFFSGNRTRVVIGDCGVSAYTNAQGKLIDAVRGTPEYAPRVKALLWSAALSPAYDYGSFGLVLCKLATGHSMFEGMPIEEIAAAWEQGLQLPPSIEGRMRTLVQGLLLEDEERRWGYEQVKRWCEGEFVSSGWTRSRPKPRPEKRPLIFGRFDGALVSAETLPQLAKAIRAHWNRAEELVTRRELADFIRQFDPGLAEEVRQWAQEQEADAAVFRLLCRLDGSGRIFYCGRDYGTPADYVETLAQGKDEAAVRLMASGLFTGYLRERKADPLLIDRLEQCIQGNNSGSLTAIQGICFALRGAAALQVHGEEVHTLEELVQAILPLSTSEISALLETEELKGWLYKMGFCRELEHMAELEET